MASTNALLFRPFLFLALILHHLLQCTPSTATTAPNIMFILADDLGWGNVGFHNDENPQIRTPNMDSLVASGVELNRHYVASHGAPSRAAFQSGRLPVHVNIGNTDGLTDPSHGIPASMTGIASKLKESDHKYATHLVGKWDCGFATYSQLPTRKGYDSFYGMLSKSMDYFKKTKIHNDGCICSSMEFHDLWEDEEPVYSLDKSRYSELEFAERVLDTIDAHDAAEGPFFIMYSSHLPHSPAQIPMEYLLSTKINNDIDLDADDDYDHDYDNETVIDIEGDDDLSMDRVEDTNLCQRKNEYVYPGFADKEQFECRSIVQSQVNLLDDIVGQIVDKLVEKALWEDTLLIFTTDNGGSLDLDETAGNNYPLRGGKMSNLEGGIRATTFVSGGFLPESQYGKKENGLMHIADWYTTFCAMLDIYPSDEIAVADGLPDIDGFNMWPLISGETDVSPRTELVISGTVFISGDYKLNVGSTQYAVWQGSSFPNATTPSQDELSDTMLNCRQRGCLFNVADDFSEHIDLAESETETLSAMKSRLQELRQSFYSNDRMGSDSCPDDFDADDITNDEQRFCGCWMALNNYGSVTGPYQDLNAEQLLFGGMEDLFKGEVTDWHLYVILTMIVCALLIIAVSGLYCYRCTPTTSIETSRKVRDEKTAINNLYGADYGSMAVDIRSNNDRDEVDEYIK